MVGSSFKLETYPSPPRWKETHPCPPCIGREFDIGVRFSLALINSLVHIIHIRINFPVFAITAITKISKWLVCNKLLRKF